MKLISFLDAQGRATFGAVQGAGNDQRVLDLGPLLGAGLTWRLPRGLGVVAAVDVGQHRFDGLPAVRPVLWSLGVSVVF